jgi:MFS family permease
MTDNVFNFWFFVTASDAVGALLAAVLLYRLDTRFGRRLGLFTAAIAFEAVVAAASLFLFFPNEATAAPWFAIARILGRGVKATAVWVLALWLLNLCQRPREGIHHTQTAPRAEVSSDGKG